MSRKSNLSENEDDPEICESSGDEWKEEPKDSRRSSQRLRKKPRPVFEPGSEEEDDDEDEEEEEDEDEDDSEDSDEEPRKRKSSKNGTPSKRRKISGSESNSNFSADDVKSEKSEKGSSPNENKSNASLPSSRGLHRKFIPKTIYSEEYATGSFVILKKDAQVGDPSKHPCIWRIDGKALLQKYEAFDQDDKVRHRNTSIYTGWSPMDKDLYAPVTVDVIHHSNQNLTVELRWEKLKEINIDSD